MLQHRCWTLKPISSLKYSSVHHSPIVSLQIILITWFVRLPRKHRYILLYLVRSYYESSPFEKWTDLVSIVKPINTHSLNDRYHLRCTLFSRYKLVLIYYEVNQLTDLLESWKFHDLYEFTKGIRSAGINFIHFLVWKKNNPK